MCRVSRVFYLYACVYMSGGVRVCLRVNYFSKFVLSPVGDGTHIPHISIGIHAAKKFNER